MKPHRDAEPIHKYYAKELDIEAVLTPVFALSCPVRPYLKRKYIPCKGHIGPFRTERIFLLLEDLHFHKSFNGDASPNYHAIAAIARISYLIGKSIFCSKHKADDYEEISQPLYDRIYSKALNCALFQCYDGGDWIRELHSITRIMQSSIAGAPDHCQVKHAREEEGEEEENDLIQPSAPKKPRPSITSCANSYALGDIVWPPSDDPFWIDLPWPSTDPLFQQQKQQSSANVNPVTSLQGGDAPGGNNVQQMKSDGHWWLTPLPPLPSREDTTKPQQHILPNDGFQSSAMMTMTACQASPSVEKLARINARVGSSSSSSSSSSMMGSNVDPVTSQQGVAPVEGNGSHQATGVAGFDGADMNFDDVNFINDVTFINDVDFDDMISDLTGTKSNDMSSSNLTGTKSNDLSSSNSTGTNSNDMSSSNSTGTNSNDMTCNLTGTTFNDMTCNSTGTNSNDMSSSNTSIDPLLPQSTAPSASPPSNNTSTQPNIASSSEVSSTVNSRAATSQLPSSQTTTPNPFTDEAADALLEELFPQ